MKNKYASQNLQRKLEKSNFKVVSQTMNDQQILDLIITDDRNMLNNNNNNSIPIMIVDWTRDAKIKEEYFIRKPIQIKELRGKLNTILQMHMDSDSVELKKIKLMKTTKAKILIVDDNVLNRRIVQNALELIGYTKSIIYFASNGEEAIINVSQKICDVILMDLQMPIMDGYEATKEIRKKYGKKVYIIALTANATTETEKKCFQVGMNGFLTKPVQQKKIKNNDATSRKVYLG